MSDMSGRKTPKQFEPPPWERDRFDELASRKAEEEARAAAQAEAAAAQVEAARKAEEEADRRLREAAMKAAVDRGDGEAIGDIDQMMAVLQAEEPSAAGGFWKAGVIAGAFMVILGGVFMVWGIVALRVTQGAGTTGQLGAGILVFFGIGFIAIAAWTIQRSLQQRGAS